MIRNKPLFMNLFLLTITIAVDCIVPLIIWPMGTDYFYYPKISIIYILIFVSSSIILIVLINSKIRLRFSWELIPLSLFIVMVIFSTLLSPYKHQALWGAFLRYEGAATLVSYFLILYISFLSVGYKNELKIVVIFILTAAFIISLIAILQYFGVDLIPKDAIRSSWHFVSYATLGNPNFLGSYLCIVLPIAVCLFFYSDNSISKVALYFLCIVFYSALICCRTRSSWIGAIAGCFILLFLIYKRLAKQKNKLILLALSFIIATYLLNGVHNGLISSKIDSLISDYKTVTSKDTNKSNIGSQRMFIWERTINHIYDRPLWGSGPDTFDKVFSMTAEEAEFHFGSSNIYVDKAHNEYLQIIITLGFPALFFYLCFLFILLYKSVIKTFDTKNNIYIICLTSSVISYITQGFFNISVVSVAPLYWSILGLLIGANYVENNQGINC